MQSGPLAPCPAWLTGVRTTRGPSFCWSGFEDQDTLIVDGHHAQGIARTRRPCMEDLQDWASELLGAYNQGIDPRGGWAPHRSIVANWLHPGADNDGLYYKAGDEGLYDLSYWPLELRCKDQADMETFVLTKTRAMVDDQVTFESCVRRKFMVASVGRAHEREDMMEFAMDFCEDEMVEAMRVRSHAMRQFLSVQTKAALFARVAYPRVPAAYMVL